MPRRGAARTFELGGVLPGLEESTTATKASTFRDKWLEMYGDGVDTTFPGLCAELARASAALRHSPGSVPALLVSMSSTGDSPRLAQCLREAAATADDATVHLQGGGSISVAFVKTKQFASARAKVRVVAPTSVLKAAERVHDQATILAQTTGNVASVVNLVKTSLAAQRSQLKTMYNATGHSVPSEGDAPVGESTAKEAQPHTQALKDGRRQKKVRRGLRKGKKEPKRHRTFADLFKSEPAPSEEGTGSPKPNLPACTTPPRTKADVALPTSRVSKGTATRWDQLFPSPKAPPGTTGPEPKAAAAPAQPPTKVVELAACPRVPACLPKRSIKHHTKLCDLLSSDHVYSNTDDRHCVQACLETAAGEPILQQDDLALLHHAATIAAAQHAMGNIKASAGMAAPQTPDSDVVPVTRTGSGEVEAASDDLTTFRSLLVRFAPDDSLLSATSPPVLLPGLHLLMQHINNGHKALKGADLLPSSQLDVRAVMEDERQEDYFEDVYFAFALTIPSKAHSAHLQLLLIDHDHGVLHMWNPDLPSSTSELSLHKCLLRLHTEGVTTVYRVAVTPLSGHTRSFRDRLRDAFKTIRDEYPPLPLVVDDSTAHARTLIAGKATRVVLPEARRTRHSTSMLEKAKANDPLTKFIPQSWDSMSVRWDQGPHTPVGRKGLTKLAFVSWNVARSCGTHLHQVIHCARTPQAHTALLALCLTEPGGHGTLDTEVVGLQCFRPNPPDRPPGRSEVALLLDKRLGATQLLDLGLDGRCIVACSVPAKPKPLAIIAAYVPNWYTAQRKKPLADPDTKLPHRQEVWEQLHAAVESLQHTHMMVVMGDLNCHPGDSGVQCWGQEAWVNETGVSEPNEDVQELDRLCQVAGLSPPGRAGVSTHATHKRALDHILLCPLLKTRMTSPLKVTTKFSSAGRQRKADLIFSDHYLLSSTVVVKLVKETRPSHSLTRPHSVPPWWPASTPSGQRAQALHRNLLDQAQATTPLPTAGAEEEQALSQLDRLVAAAAEKAHATCKGTSPEVLQVFTDVSKYSKLKKKMTARAKKLRRELCRIDRRLALVYNTARSSDPVMSCLLEDQRGMIAEDLAHTVRMRKESMRRCTHLLKKKHKHSVTQIKQRIKELALTDPFAAHVHVRRLSGRRKKAGATSIQSVYGGDGKLVYASAAVKQAVREQMAAIISPDVTALTPLRFGLARLLPSMHEEFRPPEVWLPTKRTVMSAIDALNLHRNPGTGQFQAEHLKYSSPAFKERYTQALLDTLAHGSCPAKYHEGVGTLIPKKTSRPGRVDTYRLIVCRPPQAKLFFSVVAACVEAWMKSWISREQAGFSKSRNTHEQIIALQEAANGYLRRSPDKHVLVMFIDFKAAFDSVSHAAILEILEAARLPEPLLKAVSEYMSRASVSIHTAHGLCDPLPVTSGVPQGGALSPLLFKVAIDVLSQRLQELPKQGYAGAGVPTSAGRLTHTLYADDLACLATSPSAMQRMFHEVRAVGARVGLKINPRKSGIMVITNAAPVNGVCANERRKAIWRSRWLKSGKTLTVGGVPIERTRSYVFLGAPLCEDVRKTRASALKQASLSCTQAGFACSALLTGEWVGIDLKQRIGSASITAAADYILATQVRNSVLPLREVDRGLATALSKTQIGMQSSLARMHNYAKLAVCGFLPAHIRATKLRSNIFRKLISDLHAGTPVARVMLQTLPVALDMLPSPVTMEFLVNLNGDLDRARSGIPPPFALHGLLDLWLHGCLPSRSALEQLVQGDGDADTSSGDSVADTLDLDPTPPKIKYLGLAASSSSSLMLPPDFPADMSWRARQHVVCSFLHIAQSSECPALGYSPTGGLHRVRRPRPYHVGVGARFFCWLHPIPSAPSPLLWVCEGNRPQVVKVHLWQTLQLFHGEDTPTLFEECPLCGSVSWATLHEHVLLSCRHPALDEARQDALAAMLATAAQSNSVAQGGHPSALLTIPASLTRALHSAKSRSALPRSSSKLLLRLLLCGQWPFRIDEDPAQQLWSPEGAAVMSHPHLRLRSTRGPVKPPAFWKKLLQAGAGFTSSAWDIVLQRMLRLTSPEHVHVQRHARYLWWAAHGRACPFPGYTKPVSSAVNRQTRDVRTRRTQRTYFPDRSQRGPPRSFSQQSTLFDHGLVQGRQSTPMGDGPESRGGAAEGAGGQ